MANFGSLADRHPNLNQEALEALRDLQAKRDYPYEGMTLKATVFNDGAAEYTFDNVSVDSARMEKGVLVFEQDDVGGSNVKIVSVPNVAYWETYYE